ncbi:MAG: SpoIIE family protein phosphatase, partial [Anaerolineales bacterium]|nr:SpoIIE family protein phosphatase [Anaerolineales bacterium]
MPLQQLQPPDALSWPSISFALLFAALFLVSYVLWRRYQSRQLLIQRVAELEQLSAAGWSIVTAELDVDALCALIAREAGQVIDNTTFQVGLFAGPLYEIVYWTIDGVAQPTPQSFDLSQQPGLVGWIRQHKEALLVHDFERQTATLPAAPRYVSHRPPRSAIFIPMVRGDTVIGVLAAQSLQPNRFADEDMRRLMILANQAAAAIVNARLYEQAELRAAQLELVHQIAHQVNAVTEPESIFEQVVQLTHEQFGFEPVTIYGIDPLSGDAVRKASSDGTRPDLAVIRKQTGIVGTAVSQRRTLIADDVDTAVAQHRPVGDDDLTTPLPPPPRAEIAIPLIVNEHVLGALHVCSPHHGVAAEQTVLEALAAQVAGAIYKTQQLAQQQERAWLTTAQLEVAAALSRSAQLDEIARAVTRLTPMLTGVALCGLLLWDDELEAYRGQTLTTVEGQEAASFGRRVYRLGQWPALDAVHVGQLPLTTPRVPAWLQRPEPAALARITLLPLHAAGTRLGMLLTAVSAAAAPNPARARTQAELLENIADQTSRAIENAYLRQAQQEEAWVNTVLLQIAEAVNSRIELDEILTTIVRLVPMLVGVESFIILIWDEESGLFHAGPSHGIGPMERGLIETLEIELDEFPPLPPPANGGATASHYALQPLPWLEKVMGTPRSSVFPLHARGRLVGVMVVGMQAENGRPLSARRLNILNGIAQQAATALSNNRLYAEAAERERLAQELRVAHQIQASLIPHGSPDIPGFSVASFWRAAREVSGDFYDFIPLPNGSWGIVIADVADKGIPAALFMALSRTIIRTVAFTRDDPADVLMRVNDIIFAEAQSDLFVTVFYAVLNPRRMTLAYANAGHNPPLLLHNDRARLLSGNGMALGILPDVDIESREVRLQHDDILLFYTDGITESVNEDMDEFGLDRLRLAAHGARQQAAPAIIQALTDSLQLHAGDAAPFDDVTLVVLKRE